MNFGIFLFSWIVVLVDVNSFISFQVPEPVESVEEVSPEPMEDETAAEAMAALSLGASMNSGHSKKKKKRKRRK